MNKEKKKRTKLEKVLNEIELIYKYYFINEGHDHDVFPPIIDFKDINDAFEKILRAIIEIVKKLKKIDEKLEKINNKHNDSSSG